MTDTVLNIPPFNIRVRSPIPAVNHHIDFFYCNFPRPGANCFIDFDIQVLPGKRLRRWWHPQARFLLDGVESFFPLPLEQAAPMLEWGLNWCVASRPLGFLVMHAGLLARSGEALMMPGVPGAGKSTMCASLSLLNGWRLLSDELAILDTTTGLVQSHPRPISLKNKSIEVVSAFPSAKLGRVYMDTRKGTISHAACPAESIVGAADSARVRWVVFPRFDPDRRQRCEEISRAEAFGLISEQSFNKERTGEAGFNALCNMLTDAQCFQIVYGSTEAGLQIIEDITTP